MSLSLCLHERVSITEAVCFVSQCHCKEHSLSAEHALKKNGSDGRLQRRIENITSGRAPRKHFHSGRAKCFDIADGEKPLLKRGEAGCQGCKPAPAGRTAKAGDGGRRSPIGWHRRGYRATAVISQWNRLRLACHDPQRRKDGWGKKWGMERKMEMWSGCEHGPKQDRKWGLGAHIPYFQCSECQMLLNTQHKVISFLRLQEQDSFWPGHFTLTQKTWQRLLRCTLCSVYNVQAAFYDKLRPFFVSLHDVSKLRTSSQPPLCALSGFKQANFSLRWNMTVPSGH